MRKIMEKRSVFLILFMSLLTTLFSDSFAMNPFVIIALFFSFYKGLRYYVLNVFAMCVLAFVMYQKYALEIGFISILFLFFASIISYLFRNPSNKLYPVIAVNILYLAISLIVDFSFENLVSSVVNIMFQIFAITSIEKFVMSLKNDNVSCSSIDKAMVLMLVAIIGTFFEPVGLIWVRVILLLVALNLKNEIGALSILLSCVFCITCLHYSIVTASALFLPLFIVLILKKFNLMGYLILNTAIVLFSPTPFYLNVSFYAAFAAVLVAIIIKKDIQEKIFSYFKSSNLAVSKKEKQYLAYANSQIRTLNKYVSLIDYNVSNQDTVTPYDNAIIQIKNTVCANCPHYQLCKIRKDIAEYFDEKVNFAKKKKIQELCITPYKLITAIETYYLVYKNGKIYYNKYDNANESIKYILKSIKNPLSSCEKRFDNKSSNLLERRILESNLHYFDFHMQNDDICVTFNLENYEHNIEEFDAFLKSNSDCEFEKNIQPQNILTSTVTVIYKKKPNHRYDFGVLSKAIEPPFNGDNYSIIVKDSDLFICLCDGMGHGEVAEKCSKYLLSAVETHLEMETPFSAMVKDLNNMLLIKNHLENYCTLDLIRINLTSLKGSFVKAGSFVSYILREGKIIAINKHNLPLGIVNDCTFDSIAFEFKVGDVLAIVSDGIGERIEDDNKVLLLGNKDDMNQFTRTIFNTLNNENAFTDDSTIITIKIL